MHLRNKFSKEIQGYSVKKITEELKANSRVFHGGKNILRERLLKFLVNNEFAS